MYSDDFVRLFWSKVKKTRGCWNWTASLTKAGYGQIQARKIRPEPMLCHRVSWELHNGYIVGGLHVLHTCDNPACVRPEHLFLGTQRTNNKDRQLKGRTASGDRNGARTQRSKNPFVRDGGSGLKNEKHPMAKLSDVQIVAIRKAFRKGSTLTAIAKMYLVSITHVSRITKGESRCP